MNIAFIISRTIYYKYYSSLIDEALSLKFKVVCLHNYSTPKSGLKGYQFPDINKTPNFLNGSPKFENYLNIDGLVRLVKIYNVDCIVSLDVVDKEFLKKIKHNRPIWVLLQHHADLFVENFDKLNEADLILAKTRIWLDYALKYNNELKGSDLSTKKLESLISKVKFIGFPQLESAGRIDSSKIRIKYNIPKGKKVILLLHHGPSHYNNFWGKKIFNNNRLIQLLNILVYRKFKYLKLLYKNMNFKNLMIKLSYIAKNNDSIILLKYRKKTPLPNFLKKNVFRCIHDESEYPSTILELLKISDICISTYKSMAVLESIYMEVPFVSINPLIGKMSRATKELSLKINIFYNDKKNNLFNFPGASYILDIPKIFQNYKNIRLSDFKIIEEKKSLFIQKFIKDKAQAKSSSNASIDSIKALLNHNKKEKQKYV